MNRFLMLTAMASVSCSTTRSQELTAVEHRDQAALHDGAALRDREKYDPGRTMLVPDRGPFVDSQLDSRGWYNPTADALWAADIEMRAAAEHLAAAKKLEAFADIACRDIPPAERAACPLLASSVTQVQPNERGLILVLKPSVDGAEVSRRLNCHLAYDRANGFSRPFCPLFVNGIRIALRAKSELEFSARTPEVAQELQRQAQRIFTGTMSAPPD